MKKIVKIVSIALAIISIFLSLSACGGKEKEIIGMWYDDDGEVLNVQKDGTYNFEGEYGSGTWKILDDKETIEFTDFYGMTKNIEITQDDLGIYIFYHQERLYKDAYPSQTEDDANQNDEMVDDNVVSKISIEEAGLFSSGCAWVVYNENVTEYNGLIDKNGKLLFCKEKTTTVESFGALDSGLGCFFVYPNNFTLINSTGKVVGSTENKDFDYVVGYGDGQALVYKKVTDISTVKHMYGVLDSNGNWVYPLTDWSVEPKDTSSTSVPQYGFYASEGMFVVCIETGGYTQNFILFNSKTSEKLFLYDVRSGKINKSSFEFINGFAIVGNTDYLDASYMSTRYITEYVSVNSYNKPDYITVLPSDFIIYSDGKYKAIDAFDKCDNNITMKKKSNAWTINNHKTNKTFVLSEYDANNVELKFTKDFGLMLIKGADGKNYFSLINPETGSQTFEPICYTSVSCTEAGIVYRDKDSDTSYKILDLSGNVVTEFLAFEKINTFNESLAAAKQTDGSWVYIDNSGKIVIDAINK